jgi:hypothetical protein
VQRYVCLVVIHVQRIISLMTFGASNIHV